MNGRRLLQRLKKGEGGQALVEFGLVSLTLLVVLVNIVDLMRAFWHFNTLAFAAQEGVRYAIVHGARSDSPVSSSDPSAVVNLVRDQSFGVDPAHLTVQATWPDGNNNPGSRIQVATSYNYEPILLGWAAITLSSSAEMVIQQ